MKTKLSIAFVLFIYVHFYAQNSDWKTLDGGAYLIKCPQDWYSSSERPQISTLFMLKADDSSKQKDNLVESVSLNAEPLMGETIDAEAYANKSMEELKKAMPNLAIISTNASEIAGFKAKEVIWSLTLENKIELQFKYVFFITKKYACAFAFSSTKQEYNGYVDVADKIMHSFKLTN